MTDHYVICKHCGANYGQECRMSCPTLKLPPPKPKSKSMKTTIKTSKSIKLTESLIQQLLNKPTAKVTFTAAWSDPRGDSGPGYATVTWTEEEEIELK